MLRRQPTWNFARFSDAGGRADGATGEVEGLRVQGDSHDDDDRKTTHSCFLRKRRGVLLFEGCSTGGQQGLSEAQRYPADYDGIVSGAPANARTRLHAAILWNYRELSDGVNAGLTPDKLALLSTAVLRACGTRVNGIAVEQVIDPAACAFDLQGLSCTGANRTNCLSSEERNAVEHVYAGPKTPQGKQIYPGLAWGSEAGWNLPPAKEGGDTVPFASIFRWVWGPSWNWTAFDFDKDVATMDRRLGPWLNATDPDLAKFRQMGHKLLLYHGWADPLVASQGTVNYFEQVRQRERGGTQSSAYSSTRLFMIPGMAHCGGGNGPAHLDLLPTLRAWVESGVVPKKIEVVPVHNGASAGTQMICAYPKWPRADSGSGALVCAAGK